ncbi:hypothetical protein ACIXNN_04735 [Bacteroides fragilis]
MKKDVMILTGAGQIGMAIAAVSDMGKDRCRRSEPGEYRGCLPYIE